MVDFTDRKKAEDKLQQYERVVEGLEEMIVVVDRDYRYVLANRAFLSYRGAQRDQLIGHLVPESLEQDVYLSLVRTKLDECFSGKIVKYELIYDYPLFGPRDLLISYFPIEVPGGVTGAACVLRDITELKQMKQNNRIG